MRFSETNIEPIKIEHVKKIIEWQYKEPYDIYNLEDDEEILDSFMSRHCYVLTHNYGEIIGYYYYGQEATITFSSTKAYEDNSYIDIGLGLNPKYVSCGIGPWFLNHGIDYFSNLLNYNKFRLTVLENNVRALKLYTKVGFKISYIFPSNITKANFIVMVYNLANKLS